MPQPGEIPAPPLPEPDDDLYIVHYSQERAEHCTDSTPGVLAIVVQHVLTGQQRTFAALHLAEREGIPPAELPARLEQLERRLLEGYVDFTAGLPGATWLHWAMRRPSFGFEVLSQRARRQGLDLPEVPLARQFDLANYLKRTYGHDYAPHPRLWHASRRNGTWGPGLLSEAESAEAWAAGRHAALLWSLSMKVQAIARLYELARSRRFLAGVAASPPDAATSAGPCAAAPGAVPGVPGATTATGGEIPTEAEGLEPDEEELADRLAAKGHHTKAALVRHMKGREWADLEEIKDRVQGDPHNRDGSVKGLASETTKQVKLFGSSLEYRVRGHRLRKFRIGE
jgi:hypothetical protein